MKLKDLTGMKFGRLTVIERAENKGKAIYWHCHCDCGKETVVKASHLKDGRIKSCGCWHDESSTLRATKHGMYGTKVYRIFSEIKTRCFNVENPAYKYYGGRGITMYPEWIDNFQSFYDYVSKLEHFNEKGYSIDRIDNNGNYEPNNLRWADSKTQGRNKRNNHLVEYKGAKMPLSEAAEKSGIKRSTLKERLKRGDTGERLFRPVKPSISRKSS